MTKREDKAWVSGITPTGERKNLRLAGNQESRTGPTLRGNYFMLCSATGCKASMSGKFGAGKVFGGSTGLQAGGNDMAEEGASAPARKRAPQAIRTFFVSAAAFQHRNLFQSERMADLLIDVLAKNREVGRFALHEFVVMPDHLHVLLTPGPAESLEKCVQHVKGGFSFRAKRELKFNGEVWQRGHNEHRIKDLIDYRNHVRYIWENPVVARVVDEAREFRASSASGLWPIDPAPEWFQG